MNEQQTLYADTSIELVDGLIQYGQHLKNDFGDNVSPALTIYSILDKISKNSLDTQEILKIRKQMQTLPLYYHHQCLRLFIERFSSEVNIDIKIGDQTLDSLNEVDNLEKIAKTYNEYTKRIPSIFEVIYLYIEEGLKDSSSQERISKFISDASFQSRVGLDYCYKFQKTYGEDLKTGVLTNEK